MSVEEHANGVRTRPARSDDESRCFELIEALTGDRPTEKWSAVFASHLRLERGAVVVAENEDGRILVQRTIDDARRRGCVEMGLYLVASTEGNRGF